MSLYHLQSSENWIIRAQAEEPNHGYEHCDCKWKSHNQSWKKVKDGYIQTSPELSQAGAGDPSPPQLLWMWPPATLKENRRKIEPKETCSCLIPRLLVVFTQHLEILVTTLLSNHWLWRRNLLWAINYVHMWNTSCMLLESTKLF